MMNTYPDVNSGTAGNPVGASRSSPRRSYIVRHWRGDLSLGVSYWLNDLLSTLAAAAGFVCLRLLNESDPHPLIFALAASAAWVWAVAANLWYLVGVWRSAQHHTARSGRRVCSAMARVSVVLGFLFLASMIATEILPQVAEYWRIAAGDFTVGEHELRILRGGKELEYAGGITFGATDEVRRLLDADPDIRVIHLNSLGGRIGEARRLRDLIRERRLITYTGLECVSACTIAFMGGAKRFVGADAALGFHRGWFPGFSEQDLAEANDEERQSLIADGVAPWFADRAYSTPSKSVWWPTLNELKRAGVISGVAGPADFALCSSTLYRSAESAADR
jgi:hypothetical protein